MKKQILSITLMIVAIVIACAALLSKKAEHIADADNKQARVHQNSELVAGTNSLATDSDQNSNATPTTPMSSDVPLITDAPQPTPAFNTPKDTQPSDTPPHTQAPNVAEPTPEVPVTDAYSPDTIDSLTSIGLDNEDINSLADMGVTESEITDVISEVNITPDMVAEFDNYKDIWAKSSDLERKLMIELLKQVAGKK